MVLVVGEYQIRVQLLRATRDDLAASRARRLMTERQVRLTREAALNRYRELSGLIRMY